MRITEVQPDSPEFEAWVNVFIAAGEADWGRHHTAYSARELTQFWRKNGAHRHGVAVVDGTEVVAASMMTLPQRDNPHLAFVELATVPRRRREGFGAAVLAATEDFLHAQGRTTLFVESDTPLGGDDAAVGRFAESHGYAVGQVVARNIQRHPLSGDQVEAMTAAAQVDDGYRVRTFVGELPDDVIDGRARLGAMMSTDTPLGDLDLQPETVDADRVRDELRVALAAGRTVVTGLAQETRTGEVVGYSVVEVSAATPWIGYQDDTLVAADHRGHDLGYRLKAAVALELARVAPELEVIRTWNDETNAAMLHVNTRLGYEREGTMREWQKVLG